MYIIYIYIYVGETGAGPPLSFFLCSVFILRFRKHDDVSHASPHFQRHYGTRKSKTGKLRTGNRFLGLKVKQIFVCFLQIYKLKIVIC